MFWLYIGSCISIKGPLWKRAPIVVFGKTNMHSYLLFFFWTTPSKYLNNFCSVIFQGKFMHLSFKFVFFLYFFARHFPNRSHLPPQNVYVSRLLYWYNLSSIHEVHFHLKRYTSLEWKSRMSRRCQQEGLRAYFV